MADVSKPQRRRPKTRPYKAGDLSALRRMMWFALLEAEYMLRTSQDAETTFKAIHCLGQVGGAYARLLEADEVEKRLAALEAALAEAQGPRANPANTSFPSMGI